MRIVDLTIPLDEETPPFPGDPKPILSAIASMEKDGCNTMLVCFPSHCGTHIDAPFHFLKEGKKLDEFTLDYFIGSAIMLDCKGQKEITLTTKQLNMIHMHDIVFIHTGWSDHYKEENYFLEYPVLTKETAENLVKKKIRMIGLDFPSPDKAPYAIHPIFLEKNICIVENLVNLSKLPKRFLASIIPLKLNGDGAPVRAFAMVD